MRDQFYSLSELHVIIKDALSSNFPHPVWFVAEISEIRANYNSHCYLELIEKDEKGDKIKSKMRATIWSYHYRMIKPFFVAQTGQELREGMTVLFKGKVEYHELYGLSINVVDVDPTYTIGEQEKKKQQILQQLFDDGIIDMNKELDFPVLPQRIAVVSSATAAGYGDFNNQLLHNAKGYYIKQTLFHAIMQGEKTKESVISAFHEIYDSIEDFDLVVLIRGGGATSDLIWFDDYDIAQHIAQFPIPVISGIGHERDETIADVVSHFSVKTPTAVAELILDCFRNADSNIRQLFDSFHDAIAHIIEHENLLLHKALHFFPMRVNSTMNKQRDELYGLCNALNNACKTLLFNGKNVVFRSVKQFEKQAQQQINIESGKLNDKKNELKNTARIMYSEKRNIVRSLFSVFSMNIDFYMKKKEMALSNIKLLLDARDPQVILKQGFALILKNGKKIKNISDVENEDVIETKLFDGAFKSRVLSKKP